MRTVNNTKQAFQILVHMISLATFTKYLNDVFLSY